MVGVRLDEVGKVKSTFVKIIKIQYFLLSPIHHMNTAQALNRFAARIRALHRNRGSFRYAHSNSTSTSTTPRGRSATSTAIFFGIPVATTFSLGVWQVKRLGKKKEMICKREHTLSLEPLTEESVEEEEVEKIDYRRIVVRGELQHDKEMLVGPRSAPSTIPQAVLQWGGSTGYLVITPIRTENNRTILIQRGWVPVRLIDRERRVGTSVVPLAFLENENRPTISYNESKDVTITGVVRRADEKNRFMPENNVDANDWYYVDTKSMLKSVGGNVSSSTEIPFVELVEPLPTNGWPFPRTEDEFFSFRTPPSTHVTYATTWFMLSAALALLSRNRVKHARAR